MVEVVNRNQQVKAAALRPDSVYSRVVVTSLIMPGGVGNENIAVTRQLGNNLRILKVDLWIMTKTLNAFLSGFVKVTIGIGRRTTVALVRDDWTAVMDISQLLPQGMFFYCCKQHYSFEMNKRFEGLSLRIGVYSANLGIKQYVLNAAFQISEG